MKELLQKAEHLRLFKLDLERYNADQQQLNNKLQESEKYNKENHIHYVQVENYLDKYLPMTVQKAIGKTIVAVFEGKQPFTDRYRQFEEDYLKEANRIILLDDG